MNIYKYTFNLFSKTYDHVKYISPSLLKFSILICVTGVFLLSCASPIKKEDVELMWPLPPEEPKIKWVRWVSKSDDVKGKSGSSKFLDSLLGEEDIGSGLGKPYGVHAADGRIYVSDTGVGKVAVFDFAEKKFFHIGTEGAGFLNRPIGITTDKDGYIYITDTAQDRAIIYNHEGKFVRTLGEKGQFDQPGGIAVNHASRKIYVVDIKKHNVQVFDKTGEYLFEFGKRGNADGHFNFPTNIFVDNKGKVYVTDSMNFRVQIFDAEGNFISKFGKIGDSFGQFARPKGIAVDSEGNIYVVDAAFNNVQIFNPEGQLLMFFGSMGVGPGNFWLPAGLYIDDDDKIYVADQFNRRVSIFQYLGEKYRKSQEGGQDAVSVSDD